MITIVTAPGRSGTSLTMQMLQAAGMPLMWNRLPNKSVINPHGHYELNCYRWSTEYAREVLPQCEGKAVKIFPVNLRFLTPDHDYQFIYIERDVVNVRDSQVVMLEAEHREHEKNTPAEHLADVIERQAWLNDYLTSERHVKVWFDGMFTGEAQKAIGQFLNFDALQIAKMKDCVDTGLWHFKPQATGVIR